MNAKNKSRCRSRPLTHAERRLKSPTAAAYLPALLAGVLLGSSTCMVGPRYRRPSAPVPTSYKEQPPQNSRETPGQGAKPAQPNDGAPRGKWWEIYNDPQLNALEEQVNISNQNVLAAEAQFRAARDAVRIVRSALFPTIASAPTYTNSRTSSTVFNIQAGNLTSGVRNIYNLPVDLSYQADVWGSIRRNIRSSAESAQASFAQLENARLSFQALLAENYFELYGSDGDRELLQRTVKSYQDYLQLTKDRFASGVASGADVAQAQTQLDTARAQLIDYDVARAQYEHAIAILIGKPPAQLSIPYTPIKITPPAIPPGIPSAVLERRPDIAGAERQMAAENEQIGIATATFYPSLTLTATGGLESGSLTRWFNRLQSGYWSVVPQLAETVFDAGRRHAQVAQAQALYDSTVANYRQIVLTAFQQVEDDLAALRVLEEEAKAEDQAIAAAQNALEISTYQYKAGTVSYLTVITEQAILLSDQVAAVNILTRRMTASVLLVEALGGGWNSSMMPSTSDLVHFK